MCLPVYLGMKSSDRLQQPVTALILQYLKNT